MLRNTSQRYGAVSRALHWLGALGVIAALIFIEAKGIFPKGTPLRDSVKYAHIQAGLLVLLLLFPRPIWRAGNPSPAITPQPGRLAALVAKAGHWSLYALMLALPLLGIAFIQAAGKNIDFFGFPLPLLLPPCRISRTISRKLTNGWATLSCGWPSCMPPRRYGTTSSSRTTL